METDWIEVPIPDGAVEYTYDFMKEDLRHCWGKLVHTLDDPDTYPFAYDETPKEQAKSGRRKSAYRALREKSGYIPGTFAVGDSEQRRRTISTDIRQDEYIKTASNVCSDVSWVQPWDM